MLDGLISHLGQNVSSQIASSVGQVQTIRTDELGWFIFAIAATVCALLVPSLPGVNRVVSFFLMMVVFVFSTFLLVSTDNMIGFLVLWEFTALSAWGVGRLGLRSGNPVLGALPVNAVGSLSSIAMFAFIALLIIQSGSLEIGDLRTTTPLLTMALLLTAILLKVFGLLSNAWFEGNGVAFPIGNAILAGAGTAVVGLYPFLRFAGELVRQSHDAQSLAIWAALAIALTFALAALREFDLYRIASLLAFSQFCLVLAVSSIANPQAISGSLFAVTTYVFAASVLFLSVGLVCEYFSVRHLSDMGGLARQRPPLALVFLIGVAATSGTPPFGTFVGKIASSLAMLGYPDPLVGLAWIAAWTATVLFLFRALAAVLFPPSPSRAPEKVYVFSVIPIAISSAFLAFAAASPSVVLSLLDPAIGRVLGW